MKIPAPIHFSPTLCLVPLDQNLPGFTAFIGAWLVRGNRTWLIDPGPAATIPHLIGALDAISVKHLDAILLTHIHIDHAGGVGDLVRHFADTPVICHNSAVKHLADPTRLWEGSVKTLGATARAYGSIRPVPGAVIVDAGHCPEPDIVAIETPGHAVHHVSYLVDETLFAGEAGGVFHRMADGGTYLRPATPPRFFAETSIRSIDTLISLPHRRLCYGHFGMTEDTPEILAVHRDQLGRWVETIRREKQIDPGKGIVDRCMARLLKEDTLMAGWHTMAAAVRQREAAFMANSIRGILGYLEPPA